MATVEPQFGQDGLVGAKRPLEGGEEAPASKRAFNLPPHETIFRMVVNVVDTALIIGRGGATVRQIEQDSGSRVKRLGEPPGAREQVVIIWNPERDQPEGSLNTSQNGLLECARRIVMQETPSGGALGVKLLINRSQEPALMGRDNATAERIQAETGCRIKCLHGDDLPLCALDNDVMVEISGDRYHLMHAVEIVSDELRANPPAERPGGPPSALRAQVGSGYSGGGYGGPPPPGAYGGYGGSRY